MAAAPNYEQPAAAPTHAKRLERKRHKSMSLPDEDVEQVAALRYDCATEVIAPDGPRQVTAGRSELPGARRVRGEVTKAAAYVENQLFDIASAHRGPRMEWRVPALGDREGRDLREQLLGVDSLTVHIWPLLGKLEQPTQALFGRAPDTDGDFGEKLT